MSARMDAAGYTTSGRGGSKSSAQKKAPVAKKAAPAAKKSAGKPAGKFPASMSVPGSARPMSPADHKLVRQRTAASKPTPVSSAPARSGSVPPTGRDRFGPNPSMVSRRDRTLADKKTPKRGLIESLRMNTSGFKGG